MNVRVVLIGAGSRVFTRRLVSDLTRYFQDDVEFNLVDIDPDRLALARQLAIRIREEAHCQPAVQAFSELVPALEGCDYVINSINVGGRPAWTKDFEIPARYGVKQTVADTLGIGGIMRGLRTIPEVLKICAQIEKYAPHAMFLNYTNPMAMVMMAVYRSSSLTAVGLCHSIPATANQLAHYLEIDPQELEWRAAGINHQAWFLQLTYHGQDQYPVLRQRFATIYDQDPTRFELMRKFGYFPSESSPHSAEYVSYFLPRKDWVGRLNLVPRAFLDQPPTIAAIETLVQQSEAVYLPDLSIEYAPKLIHSLETGEIRMMAVNVPNTGLIANLPRSAVVEVPALIQGHQICPTYIGELPVALAALNRQGIAVQELTVQAVLQKDREAVYEAAFLDPNLSTTLDLDQTVHLVDDLLEAHEAYLPPLAASWSVSLPLAPD
ncbi:MAG: alpha-glucosidase/alpha-galactosidase [Sulfobacillus acidophilus]|uniref:Alpha-glucosidase/alpha-galactosidase n=1 Tax=Sulfobacillus acidophilus TaxID=53633 RepID=A0A2T2WJL0_9FIRM|nr:MAG: alpha-glucosidase/alpha-galactosidase [Sulfobacillus acidophilus]